MWKKSKKLLLLLVLSLPLLPVHFSSYSYADVILTDKEAQELMSEIQESKKDLQELQNQLSKAEIQLSDVKNTYEEQKTYYEKQLKEAEKKNSSLKTAVVATGTSTVVFFCICTLLLLL